MKNSYLLGICKNEMTDGYFSDPSCKIIYKALVTFYNKYDSLPDINGLMVVIEDCYYSTLGVTIEDVKNTCIRLYGSEPQDETFIKDKITDFIRKVRSNNALGNLLNQIKTNPNMSFETDTIVNDLAKSLEVQLSNTRLFDVMNLEQVKEARLASVGSEDNSKIIKSIFSGLNASLMFGGYQPSTVNMVVAPPGCFVGDTKVFTTDIDGIYTLEELYNNKSNHIIYGNDLNGNIRTGSYSSIYLSDYTDSLVDVEINNEYVVRCTPDHPFLKLDGTYDKALSLKENDELMSFDRNDHSKINKFIVTKITEIHLEEKVPVYGIVDAKPFNNFAIALNDTEGIFVSNTGKSMFLINEGVYALKQGFKVLHILIGDMVEYDGYIRYLSCASGYNQNHLVILTTEKQQEIVQMCNQQYNNLFTRLSLLAYPSLSLKVDNLIEDIARFEKQTGYDFDMIVIDYPDNLQQEGRSLYEDGGTLYASLEKLARITKSVVLVASQPKNFFWNQEIMPLESAAESSKKQQCVDIMLSMNTGFRGASYGSALLAKARKGEVGKLFRFKTDFAKCKVEEIDENAYNVLKESQKAEAERLEAITKGSRFK